jgi:hypothetical protein
MPLSSLSGFFRNFLLKTTAPTPLAGVERGFVTRKAAFRVPAPAPLVGVERRFVPQANEPTLHPDKRGGGEMGKTLRSGYEPVLHPDKRGGGLAWCGSKTLRSGYEPVLHPGKRGGGLACCGSRVKREVSFFPFCGSDRDDPFAINDASVPVAIPCSRPARPGARHRSARIADYHGRQGRHTASESDAEPVSK